MLLLHGHIALRWSAVLRLVVAINIWPRRGQYTITPLRGLAQKVRFSACEAGGSIKPGRKPQDQNENELRAHEMGGS